MSESNSRSIGDRLQSRARKTRGLKRVLMSVLVAGSATLALSAWSGHGPHMGGAMGGAMGGGPGGGMGPGMMVGMGGPGMFMGPGAMNPERMNRQIDHMLDGLNATDAQRTQIKEIARVAAVDLKAQRDKGDGKALREKGLQLFTAPTIDAAAVDSLRQQMDALHGQSEKRVMQAMIDIGRVLTPAQRVTAGQLAKFQSDRMEDQMKRGREHPEEGRPERHGRGPGNPEAQPPIR